MPSMPIRSLKDIAAEIERDWTPRVSGSAQPIVDAMKELYSLDDRCYCDSAIALVASFLGVAET
jgi:hypothetical protein